MCGPETTDRPRGGALVALCAPEATKAAPDVVRGHLTFDTPDCPGSAEATHARLAPEVAVDPRRLCELHIVIHSSGDMTKSAAECGLFRRIPLAKASLHGEVLELPLVPPLLLRIGDDGIIGRRVSLVGPSAGVDTVVAEGVVGVNFTT